jgi:hypothetical protein
LKDKVHFSQSELKENRDEMLLENSEVVLEEARAIHEELIDYGVTAAILTEFEAKKESFKDVIVSPRSARVIKKAARVRLRELIKATDDLLKNRLDPMMVQFKTTHPDFYREYFNARIILDIGSRHEEETTPTK